MTKKTIKPVDVTLEASLLKLLASKENYNKYLNVVDIKKLSPSSAIVIKDYKKYYNLYNKDVDFGEFYTQFSQDWHTNDMEQHDVEYYRDFVFPTIENVSLGDTQTILHTLIKKQHVDEINTSIQNGLDVSKIRENLNTLEKKLSGLSREDTTVHTIASTNFEELDKSNGIPWFLPSLQHGLMSITAGQFIVVSADYGTGKTAFVIGQAVHTFRHLSKVGETRPILYFNSEGLAQDVLGRFLSNLYKDKVVGGFEEIVARRDEIKEKFLKSFNSDLFKVVQIADVGTFNAVKQKIDQYNPSLVIIDICDKLANEEDVQSLKKLYDNLRVLASQGYPIIGTSQSGDTSYLDKNDNKIKNKKWLGDHDLYGSKTGKGGSADTIITIGKEENSSLRFVSVVKKKRGQPVKLTCELQDIYSNYRELVF